MNAFLLTGAGVVAAAGALAYRHDRRADATKRQAELDERLRTNPQSVLLPIREQYVTRAGQLTDVIEAEGRAADAAATRHATFSAQFWRGNDPKLGFMVIVGVFSVLWFGLFLLQRSTDITVMQALRTVSPQLFGNVIAVAFVILGIVISGIAGMHHLLPSWLEPQRALTRVLIVSVLGVLACFLTAQVADIAQFRSIDRFTAQVNTDETTLAQLRTQKPSPAFRVQIDAAQNTLAQDQQRLDKAKSLDKTLTILVLPAELALSAFPILATELLIIYGFARTEQRHRTKRQRAQDEQDALPQRFQEQSATMLARANPDMTVDEINALLASLNSRQTRPATGARPVAGTTPRPTLSPSTGTASPTPAEQPGTSPDAQTPPADQTPPDAPSGGGLGGLGDLRVYGRPRPQPHPRPDEPAPQHSDDRDDRDDDPPPTWAIA